MSRFRCFLLVWLVLVLGYVGLFCLGVYSRRIHSDSVIWSYSDLSFLLPIYMFIFAGLAFILSGANFNTGVIE